MFSKQQIISTLRKTGILWALLALIIMLSSVSPVFLTVKNFINIFKQTSITSILAIGMTFVLLTGGIDLSVGSITALAGVLAASVGVSANGSPLIVSFLVAIGTGIICGLINGIGVAYIGFPAFIMTLGMMGIARGSAQVFTGGTPIFGVSPAFARIAAGVTFGIPNLVYYMLVIFLAAYVILTKTLFGRRIYATGGNLEAARLSGVDVKKLLVLVYVVCGALAGLCGILMASRITSGNPIAADKYEMDAISAAVIGGISMTGGYGSVLGTIVGAFILTIIQNGFDIMGISPFYKQIVQGGIILFAVFIDLKSKEQK
jgi:putative xylitol transport system permease protein